MANRLKTSPTRSTDKVLYWGSVTAAILATLDSIYLLIYKLTGDNAMCIGNGGCHDVNFSPYSVIYGIPISVIGIVAYLVILGVHLLEPRVGFFRENGPLAVFGMGLAGVAFSAYLTYLELYVIHAVCPFCVASAILVSVIFIVAIVRLARQTD
jgi:uncharacterized membrane protein